MNDDAPALVARDLRKSFSAKNKPDDVPALAGISLVVERGTLAAIVGPDGAGKTTLLRIAAGLVAPDRGTMSVLGIDVARAPQAVQDRISYMPQRFGLYEDLTVQENLDLYADLHGVGKRERDERYARLLAMTDLGRFTARPAGKLSGGMKQKLGLACTLVRSPELLLLDEPTVGVDPLSRRELWQIVEQLVRDDRLSVVVSTAYLDEAERSERVLLLREGALLASGTPAELRARAEGRVFAARPGAGEPARTLQARWLDERAQVVDAVPEAGEVRVVLRTAGSPPDAGLQAIAPRLEDGFMVLLDAARQAGRGRADRQAEVANPIADEARAREAHPSERDTPAKRSNATPVIEVEHLVRRFGDFTAVADTSFTVARGEVFGLLGPNGAGKTTTFRMLCGLLPPSSGRLRVAGVDMRTARASARRRIGYVAQKFSLYGNLSVRENLRFFAGAYGIAPKAIPARIASRLAEFDLAGSADAAAGAMPGGFRQRLAMAAALLHDPEILFLDEPTSGADPLARRAFWRRITDLAADGTTVVVTTHFMEEAEYCDRIVIQDAGRVLALGTPEEVRRAADETAREAPTMDAAFIRIVERARQHTAVAA